MTDPTAPTAPNTELGSTERPLLPIGTTVSPESAQGSSPADRVDTARRPTAPRAPEPEASYGRDPMSGAPYSEKSKAAAGLLQILLPGLGVGQFYLGRTRVGLAQLGLTVGGCVLFVVLAVMTMASSFAFVRSGGGMATSWLLMNASILAPVGSALWCLVDGALILCGHPTDRHGRPLR